MTTGIIITFRHGSDFAGVFNSWLLSAYENFGVWMVKSVTRLKLPFRIAGEGLLLSLQECDSRTFLLRNVLKTNIRDRHTRASNTTSALSAFPRLLTLVRRVQMSYHWPTTFPCCLQKVPRRDRRGKSTNSWRKEKRLLWEAGRLVFHVLVLWVNIFNCFAKLMINVYVWLFQPQGAPDVSFTTFFSESQPHARLCLNFKQYTVS